MNVAILTNFYPPEACAAATRVQSLASALRADGHDVTVVTNFPSFPAGRFRKADRFRMMHAEKAGGYRIVRLFSLLAPLPGRRLLQWLSAAFASAAYAVATKERFDAIVVSVPPITLALPALAARWRHRAKLVVDVRDVFPDIAIAMGEWRAGGLFARIAEFVVRSLYRRADLIVAVTPTAIAQIASRGVDPSRLMLARNAAETIAPAGRSVRNGRPFTAIYAGNLGLATDVDVLLDAAARLRNERMTIEVVGGGALETHVRTRVEGEGLTNVVLRGTLPRADAMERIAAADVALVPLRAGISESVPTKIYDALSVGCPVIVAAGGEARSEGSALGAFCTAPGDADALAAELRRLAGMEPRALAEIGERGRRAVQQRSGRAEVMAGLSARIASL